MSRFAISPRLVTSSVLVAAALVFVAPDALAKPTAACMSNYEKAQEHRKAGRLQRARDAMLSCAQDSCGSFISRECTNWLDELQSEMSSVVFDVNDKNGSPVADVEISVDGVKVADKLDGRAVAIDPGKRTFTFRTTSGVEVKQELRIDPGVQNRKISLILAAPAPAKETPDAAPEASEKSKPEAKAEKSKADKKAEKKAEKSEAPAAAAAPEEPAKEQAEAAPAEQPAENKAEPAAAPAASTQPSPEDLEAKRKRERTMSFILGGVGVAGIAGFGVLGLIAKDEHEDLPKCWPSCTDDDVSRVKTMYTVANVSLGVGIASLGAATYFYFKSRSGEQQTAKAAPRSRYAFDLRQSNDGVMAEVKGVF